ncbi:MAG: protein kinase [Planctomycetaceae bacterium]
MMFSSSQELDTVLDRQRDAWQAGQQPSARELLAGTTLADDDEATLDLVYNEVVLREQLGLEIHPDDYLQQYPHLQEELKLHFEIHAAIKQQSLFDTETTSESLPTPEFRQPPFLFTNPEYEILHVLGQGGMATVYKARHVRLNRPVALKMFQTGRSLTARETFRIRTESEAMARVSHPNIVKIFEIGESDGTPFLALELADHGTLADRLQQFPFSPLDAAQLIETLARAIHHAHERGIIHRDLKPANVLFAADDRPMITDFGLARVVQDRMGSIDDATRTGDTIGTPRYMAPEQAAGQHDRICPATDVHALGVLLYECLTGRPPFLAVTVFETLQQITSDDVLSPRRLQPSVPKDLETICLHCLEKRPNHRYPSALELAEDLRRFLNHEPISARPTSLPERLVKWCRRRPAKATIILGSVALTCLVLFALMFRSVQHQAHLAQQRFEVAELVRDGRDALEKNDVETAQSRFETAWMKVQAEPELADHETSVYGWLDHARTIADRQQWQRTPPLLFDDRRDEALLLSLLLVPLPGNRMEAALDSLESARTFTVAGEARWDRERECLALQQSELLQISAGAESALMSLEENGPFSSRRFHLRRAELLEELNRDSEAAVARAAAERLPADELSATFDQGMNCVRRENFSEASVCFGTVLETTPEHFAARMFQAVCFLKLDRPAEAHVALTACIAQRPNFLWGHFFRAQAHTALMHRERACEDLRRAAFGRVGNIVTNLASEELQRMACDTIEETETEEPQRGAP